jgi:putative transposase
MSKKHRIQFPGAIYHVMVRGNRKTYIFFDDIDRRRFLKLLAYVLERLGAQCFVYCLMDNHVHLVICTPRGNISRVMQRLDSLYAKYVNWRYRWTGHVFEGPFTGILIDDTDYLRNAIAYVARNPVEAGLVHDAADWHWGSHRAAMGRCVAPSFLTLDWLPRLFEAPTIQESRQLLTERVDKSGEGTLEFGLQPVEGGREFKRAARKVIGATLYKAALPRGYRALARPPLNEVFADVKRVERRSAILRAHVVHGYLMSEIARYLELHPTTISRIVNRSGSYRITRDSSRDPKVVSSE